jgi:hypothetical protein
MFEQQSYDQETPAVPLQEGDLFSHYEIKPWEFSPRIYKIVGVAVLANLLFFTGIAQTDVVTMRGCDSPFVGRVCQVLDMAYVSTVLFGTDREYVDLAYERTELGEADVTFISMDRNEPLFEYPPGYFQPEPEQIIIDPMTGFGPGTQFAPGIPSNPTYRSNNTPAQKLPKLNSNPTTGEADGWGDEDAGENPTLGKGNNGRLGNGKAGADKIGQKVAAADPTPSPAPVDETEDGAQADKLGVFINKRPLRERADETVKKIDSGAVDLTKAFKATVAGTLGPAKNGKTIVLKDPKPVPTDPRAPNDPAMEKLAQDWIVSVGDAGWFGHLYTLKVRKVIVTIEQNADTFVAIVQADQPTENEAKLVASGLNSMLSLAKGWTDGDENMFLSEMETSQEGKKFTLKFDMPKAQVQELIQRKLAETKSKEEKPNGNAGVRPTNSTAVK